MLKKTIVHFVFLIAPYILGGIIVQANACDPFLEKGELDPEVIKIERISLTEKNKKSLIGLCLANQKQKEESFIKITFGELIETEHNISSCQKNGTLDEMFGTYSLYYKLPKIQEKNIVGIITLMPIDYRTSDYANGYSELQILIAPSYRNRGLGAKFLKKFNKDVIFPKVGQKVKVMWKNQSGKDTFLGAKVYIHADNYVARKIFAKAGYAPVELCFSPYLEDKEPSAQINYIYPESDKRPCQITDQIVELIVQNTPDDREKIIQEAKAREGIHNYEDKLIKSARNTFKETKSIEKVYLEMKQLAQEHNQPFPEKKFDYCVQAFKTIPDMGGWTEKNDAELGSISFMNPQDFPSKKGGLSQFFQMLNEVSHGQISIEEEMEKLIKEFRPNLR